MKSSPATQARLNAGLTIQQVARDLGYRERTIRAAELRIPSEHLAQKLARKYGCRIDVFINPQGSGLKGAPGSGAGSRAHSPESSGDRLTRADRQAEQRQGGRG